MLDLWPDDIGQTGLKAPVTILREQASLLGKKTRNIVEAEVQPVDQSLFWMDKDDFGYAFYIVSPALGNYRYRLFSISHGVEIYPLKIRVGEDMKSELELVGDPTIQAESEEEFVGILGGIFSSTKARQVIAAILAQSGAGFEDESPS